MTYVWVYLALCCVLYKLLLLMLGGMLTLLGNADWISTERTTLSFV